jgi:hypothetical protein
LGEVDRLIEATPHGRRVNADSQGELYELKLLY